LTGLLQNEIQKGGDMKYRQLIKKVQDYSGFSDEESTDALQLMVESLAVHLNEGERKDFASQLPEELKAIALAVYPTDENSREDILKQFMELEAIDESHAKKQIKAAWHAIKDAISGGEIEHIKSQLPKRMLPLLG
jgi:uncharacterized protein (DUF2267 family)